MPTPKVINKGSTALEASRVISANPCVVLGGTIDNDSVAEQFIQFHNAASLPADGEAPKVYIRVPANTTVGFDWGPTGRAFSIGCVICNSSTPDTKTLGAADCWFDVQISTEAIR